MRATQSALGSERSDVAALARVQEDDSVGQQYHLLSIGVGVAIPGRSVGREPEELHAPTTTPLETAVASLVRPRFAQSPSVSPVTSKMRPPVSNSSLVTHSSRRPQPTSLCP